MQRKIFLVGAGISLDPPSSFPIAQQLSKLIIREISPRQQDEQLLLSLLNPSLTRARVFGRYIRFEQLLDSVASHLDPDLEILRFIENITEPNDIHYLLAQRAIQGDLVVTTNFDCLIERALSSLGANPCSVLTNKDFKRWEEIVSLDEVPIFHLHGAYYRYINHRVYSSKETIKATLRAVARGPSILSLHPDRHLFLKESLVDHELWVIGYSGSDDLDIMPSMNMLESKSVKWISHEPSHPPSDRTLQTIRDLESHSNIELGYRDRFFIQQYRKSESSLQILYGLTRDILKDHFGELQPLSTHDIYHSLPKYTTFFAEWGEQYRSTQSSRHILFSDLLLRLGMLDEAMEQTDLALSNLKTKDTAKFKSAIMKSKLSVRLGLPEDSEKWSLKAIRRLPRTSTVEQRVSALHQRGYALYKQNRADAALKWFLRAETEAKASGLKSWQSIIMHDKALIFQDQAKLREALSFYKRSLSLAKSCGDIQHASWSLHQLAACSYELCLFQQASYYIKDSIAISSTIGDINHLSFAEHELGLLDFQFGRLSSALRRFKRAIRIDTATGHKEFLGIEYMHIGIVYLEANKLHGAEFNFSIAMRLLDEASDIETQSELFSFRAQQQIQAGRFSEALNTANQALKLAKEAGNSAYLIRARFMASLASVMTGDLDDLDRSETQICESVRLSLKVLSLDLLYILRKLRPEWRPSKELVKQVHWAVQTYALIGNRNRADVLKISQA